MESELHKKLKEKAVYFQNLSRGIEGAEKDCKIDEILQME